MIKSQQQALQELQREVLRRTSGSLIVVSLRNKDELQLLFKESVSAIQQFHASVQQICEQMTGCTVISDIQQDRLYVLTQNASDDAGRLASIIYNRIQLYTPRYDPGGYLNCSVGIIKFPQISIGNDAEKLLALLSYGGTTISDRPYYFNYDDHPIDISAIGSRNDKLNLLRLALQQKAIRFMYQPIIDSKTGSIIYYECLLRIKDENDQWVSVGSMISEAESNGLINVIDAMVAEMAITELRNDSAVTLSVNISNLGVLNSALLRTIDGLLTQYHVANRLIIEITETSLNRDFKTTQKFIETLRKHGCRFAIDDFGSGFTSFQQLLTLPIDIIKIDGSYIRNILSNGHSKFFVEGLIRLAEDLRIKTVAEFVENDAIAKFLIDLKISGMQGNFFHAASKERVKSVSQGLWS